MTGYNAIDEGIVLSMAKNNIDMSLLPKIRTAVMEQNPKIKQAYFGNGK